MPLLRNNDKSKISKRKNPVSINYYRDAGILPHALLNFLGLMGWSFGDDREKFTLTEMVAAFTWDRISLGGPVFALDKLTWLNEKYIHELSNDELADALIAWRLRKDYLAQLVPLVRQRIKRLDDFVPATDLLLRRRSRLRPTSPPSWRCPTWRRPTSPPGLLGLRRSPRGPRGLGPRRPRARRPGLV
jgi:glutamyl-tRNA synthetase